MFAKIQTEGFVISNSDLNILSAGVDPEGDMNIYTQTGRYIFKEFSNIGEEISIPPQEGRYIGPWDDAQGGFKISKICDILKEFAKEIDYLVSRIESGKPIKTIIDPNLLWLRNDLEDIEDLSLQLEDTKRNLVMQILDKTK